MKTINKRVVEIVEPQNEYIERVLVFLRPEARLSPARGRGVAQQYAQSISGRRVHWWVRLPVWQRVLVCVAVAGVCTVLCLVLWL